MSYLTFSEKKAGQLLVHFRKASEASRIRMTGIGMKLFNENKAVSGEDKQTTMYYCLLHGIYLDWSAENIIHTKGSLDDYTAERLFEKRIAEIKTKKKKRATKEERVKLQYMQLVIKLRSNGLSWRQVVAYLKKYHAFKISDVYIQQVFEKNL